MNRQHQEDDELVDRLSKWEKDRQLAKRRFNDLRGAIGEEDLDDLDEEEFTSFERFRRRR
jgi:hypothetical protein